MRGAIPSRPRSAAPRTTAAWLLRMSRLEVHYQGYYDLRMFGAYQSNIPILKTPCCKDFVEVVRLPESSNENNALN
jgi:hypothetical protein